MNRREFLAVAGIVAIAPQAPAIAAMPTGSFATFRYLHIYNDDPARADDVLLTFYTGTGLQLREDGTRI